MFAQMWLILDQNNDLDICGMFAHFTFHVKIEPLLRASCLHISG